MPGLTGATLQHFKIPSGAINLANDPSPGLPVSTAQISGSIVQPYLGMVGGKLWISEDDAKKLSSPASVTNGTPLYGGLYMYVQTNVNGADAAHYIQGRLAFWTPLSTVAPDLYTVDNLESSNNSQPLLAGVFLNVAANPAYTHTAAGSGPVTAGNFTFIQIAGRFTLQIRGTSTNASSQFPQWAKAGAGTDNATFDGAAAGAALSVSAAVGTTATAGSYQGASKFVIESNAASPYSTAAANGGIVLASAVGFPFIWRE